MLRTYFTNLTRPLNLLILAALAVVSVLIWIFGPDIAYGEQTPLASRQTRLWLIVFLFAGFLVFLFTRQWLARRANARLIDAMLVRDDIASPFDEDGLDPIRERLQSVLKLLKTNLPGGRRNGDYVYRLPWYLVIGPAGAGKSTLLRNSGLTFPLSQDDDVVVQGLGGTRDCDWWVANEAVLIDTAGRFTTQNVNAQADIAAWNGFLQLLRRHRPRRPINGVILTIDMASITAAGEAERLVHAKALRLRLRELHRAFQIRIPVYVLLTKCDQITGFNEFAESLSTEEREQILGVTFPNEPEQLALGPHLDQGLLGIAGKLEQRLAERFSAERNEQLRRRMFAFPYEWVSISQPLKAFMSEVFRANRYEAQPILRGVYFTSAAQSGAPIDWLVGDVRESLSMGRATSQPVNSGRSYFIHELMTRVIVPEQELVGRNKVLERQLFALRAAAGIAILSVTAGLSAFWLAGLNTSLHRIDGANAVVADLREAIANPDMRNQFSSSLPVLDAAAKLESLGEGQPGWLSFMPMAIDARPSISAAGGSLYERLLQSDLLPAMRERVGGEVSRLAAIANPDTRRLRDELEAYLMLTTGQNFDAGRIGSEFERQAAALFSMNPVARESMQGHFSRLLEQLPQQGAPDLRLVERARDRLKAIPPALDVYRRMQADARDLPPVDVLSIMGTGTLRIFGEVNVARVPGLYTRNGFYKFFLPQLGDYVRRSVESDWVLGGEQQSAVSAALGERIVKLYVEDYIAAWREALTRIRPVEFNSLGHAQSVLKELSAPESSLVSVIKVLKENTDLPIPGENQAGQPGQPGGQPALTLPGGAVMQAAQQAALKAALGNAVWPGTPIRESFLPLTSLIDPANMRDSVDSVQKLLGEAFGAASGITSAPDPDKAAFDYVKQRIEQPLGNELGRMKAGAVTRPEPINAIMTDITTQMWRAVTKLAYRHANRRYRENVLPVCTDLITYRYPFVSGAQDEAPIEGFSDLFAQGGALDEYFTDYIEPFVSARDRGLSEQEFEGSSLGISRDALDMFEQAQAIRSIYFDASGANATLRFTVQPSFLDHKALRSSFSLNGERLVYRHGPERGKNFSWNGSAAATALLEVTLSDGTSRTVRENGSWSLLRLIEKQGGGGGDGLSLGISKGNARAEFRMRGNGIGRALDPSLFSAFSCPARL